MEGLNRGNSRNGKRSKTVLTDAAGAVEIEVPRDREGTFAPVIARLAPGPAVRCRHGRAEPVQPRADQRGDLRPLRRGLRRERAEDTITRITDTVLEEMAAWWPGPLERVYAAILDE